MAAALRRLNAGEVPPPVKVARGGAWARAAVWAAAIGLFVLPLVGGLVAALDQALAAEAWQDLRSDPQLPRALGATLTSALASTTIALVLTLLLTTWLHATPHWPRLAARLAPMLAVPHAAFAIGLAWLVAPSGAVARLLAPLAGWTAPPAWATVHDPQALLLTAVLVLKELPFLLWNMAALLARPEVALQLRAQTALGRSLGWAPHALWWRVLWPLWLPRLAWPLWAVLAYSLTVVDLALIVGPSTPPTLAALAYGDLADPSPLRQQRGAAAAVLLALLLAASGTLAWLAWRGLRRPWLRWAVSGRRPEVAVSPAAGGLAAGAGRGIAAVLAAVYVLVGGALALLSVAGVWTFPSWTPQVWTLDAWRQVVASAGTVGFTLVLAVLASGSALLLVVAWFEATSARWDARATAFVLAPLVLPGLLLMAGLYRGALTLQLDGTLAGLWWVHLLVVLPYVFITLQPAWRGFDRRYEVTALTLGRSRPAFWWRVKWPLLAAPLASALAVGFAVSVAQFLATQFLGAGRHATVTTEAVTLASGGQRTLAAAFAVLQALLPLAAFALAQRWQRRRR